MCRLLLFIVVLLYSFPLFPQQNDSTDLKAFNEYLGTEKADAFDQLVASFEDFLGENYPEKDDFEERAWAYLRHLRDTRFERDSTWRFDTERMKRVSRAFHASGMYKEVWYQKLLYLSDMGSGYRISPSDTGRMSREPPKEIQELTEDEKENDAKQVKVDTLDLESLEDDYDRPSPYDTMTFRERDSIMAFKMSDTTRGFNDRGKYLYGLAKYGMERPFIKEYVKYVRTGYSMVSPNVKIQRFFSEEPDLTDPFIKRVTVIGYFHWIVELEAQKVQRGAFEGEWVVDPTVPKGISKPIADDSAIAEYKRVFKEQKGKKVIVSDSTIQGLGGRCVRTDEEVTPYWSHTYFTEEHVYPSKVFGVRRRYVNVLRVDCEGKEGVELIRVNKDELRMPYDGVVLTLKRKG